MSSPRQQAGSLGRASGATQASEAYTAGMRASRSSESLATDGQGPLSSYTTTTTTSGRTLKPPSPRGVSEVVVLEDRRPTSPVTIPKDPTQNSRPASSHRPTLSNSSLGSSSPASLGQSPYSGLQYAPRQARTSHAARPSHINLTSHATLLHGQQHTQQALHDPASTLLTPAQQALPTQAQHLTVSGEEAAHHYNHQQQQQQTSAAALKLSIQQLQADAEHIGVRRGSVGWALLERLQAATEGEWLTLANLLATSSSTADTEARNDSDVILSLPVTPQRTNSRGELVPPSISQVYNHIVFLTSKKASIIQAITSDATPSPATMQEKRSRQAGNEVDFATLSGLRGSLIITSHDREGETLVTKELHAKSFIIREDMSFINELPFPDRRAYLFSTFSPLPCPRLFASSSFTSSPQLDYPRYELGPARNALTLPAPRLNLSQGSRERALSSSSTHQLSPETAQEQRQRNRASTSFATLFGGRRSNSDVQKQPLELLDTKIPPAPTSPTSTTMTTKVNASAVQSSTRAISVAAIGKEIHRSDVLSGLGQSMANRIRASLQSSEHETMLDDIVEVICSFAAIFVPPPSINSSARKRTLSGARSVTREPHLEPPRTGPDDGLQLHLSSLGANADVRSPISPGFVTSPHTATLASAPFLQSPDDLSESFQDFFASVREQIEAWVADSESVGKGVMSEREKLLAIEKTVNERLTRVEEVICSEVYDRIFCPHSSSDRFHDESLTSRIAALNVLGLGLAHLGLVIPDKETDNEKEASDALDAIIRSCGEMLQSLNDHDASQAPGAKLSILVEAHRLIVEGLDRLPFKIELRDEEEEKAEGAKGGQRKSELSEDTEAEGEQKKSMKRTTSSTDLILPLLIFSIVKSNPMQMASNLLYVQRFRAESLLSGGEASYCLVNVQAAVTFLENADPASLGLRGPQVENFHNVFARSASLSEGSPAPFAMGQTRSNTSHGAVQALAAVNEGSLPMPVRMRARLTQEITELAGMSNRAITGVMGTSMTVFGRMMGAGASGDLDAAERERGAEAIGGRSSLYMPRSASQLKLAGAEAPPDPTLGTGGTDYSRDEDGLTWDPRPDGVQREESSGSHSSKPSISTRLASLPVLNRLAAASSPVNVSSRQLEPSPTLTSNKELPPTDWESSNHTAPPPPPSSLKPKSSRSQMQDDYLFQNSDDNSGPRAVPHTPKAAGPAVQSEQMHLPASLQSPYPRLSRPPTASRPLHVVLATTGSVASVKLPLMVRKFLEYRDVRVQIISTKSSRHFFDPSSLEQISKEGVSDAYSVAALAEENSVASLESQSSKVDNARRAHLWTDEDEWASWSKVGDAILHIELRRWADIVLVAPCSANTLSKINAGACDDLLTSFLRALSPTTPTLLFPAMNTLMWMHPITTRHLHFATEVLGYEVIGPIAKRLACGDLGQGAMYEWSDIVQLVVDRYGLERRDDDDAKTVK